MIETLLQYNTVDTSNFRVGDRLFFHSTIFEDVFLFGWFPGIPRLVLMTKVDEACPFVSQDIRNIYRSSYIKETVRSTLNSPVGL